MKKYEVTTSGEFHTNHNEDYLISHEIGENKIMIAVMDGCSMGVDSYFGSTLIGKLLRKISKELDYKEFIEKRDKNLDEILEMILMRLFKSLIDLKNQLDLEIDELLSTLILGVVDKRTRSAELIVIGDGIIIYDSHVVEYDQENKPDYLGYHLGEDFIEWYGSQHQKLSLEGFNDISISTDGIFTFKKYDDKDYEKVDELNLIDYLMINKEGMENNRMLTKRLLEIEQKYGLKPTDDITIIRLIFE